MTNDQISISIIEIKNQQYVTHMRALATQRLKWEAGRVAHAQQCLAEHLYKLS